MSFSRIIYNDVQSMKRKNTSQLGQQKWISFTSKTTTKIDCCNVEQYGNKTNIIDLPVKSLYFVKK